MKSRQPLLTVSIVTVMGLMSACNTASRAGDATGAPVATEMSFATGLGTKVSDLSPGQPVSDYVAVSDSLGAIEIEVPTSWNVVDGSSYASEGGVTYASIRVAPSLNDFMSGWDTPGVIFRVTADEGEAGGPVQVLDDSRSSESLTLCNLDDRYEYNDSRYKGFYDHYTDCGGPGGSHYLILAAEPVQGPGNELVYVELQVVSDADLTTGDHILKTFHLVGALP